MLLLVHIIWSNAYRLEEINIPFCNKCGAKLEEDTRFCEKCGTKVEKIKKGNGRKIGEKRISKRSISISIASVICWITGIMGIITGIGLFIGANIPFFMDIMAGTGINYYSLLYVSLISTIEAVLLIFAAYGLWHVKRYGAIAAFIGLGICTITYFFEIMTHGSVVALYGIFGILLNTLSVILIIIGWKSLKRTTITI